MMNKLRAKIAERGLSVSEFRKKAELSSDTWYRRVRKGVTSFSVAEIRRIASALDLTAAECAEIFFNW